MAFRLKPGPGDGANGPLRAADAAPTGGAPTPPPARGGRPAALPADALGTPLGDAGVALSLAAAFGAVPPAGPLAAEPVADSLRALPDDGGLEAGGRCKLRRKSQSVAHSSSLSEESSLSVSRLPLKSSSPDHPRALQRGFQKPSSAFLF